MHPTGSQLLLSLSILLAITPMVAAGEAIPLADETRIRMVDQAGGFLLTERDEKILFYQRQAKSLHGKFKRAHYVHPLYDLDGNELTEDFPDDHPHHRGIYWAWHQLRIGGEAVADPWMCRNIVWDVRDVSLVPVDANSSVLCLNVIWKCRLSDREPPGGERAKKAKDAFQPVVEETAFIRVFKRTDDIRKIDFETRLRALAKDVSIGGSEDDQGKGYGGFSVRIRMPAALRLTGANGPLVARISSLQAGPWVDFSAPFGTSDRISGLTILCHPSLPQLPPPWILRQHGSMQNPVFPGRVPVPLSLTKPIVLRYRLVVHRSGPPIDRIRSMQKAYEQEALPRYPDEPRRLEE